MCSVLPSHWLPTQSWATKSEVQECGGGEEAPAWVSEGLVLY